MQKINFKENEVLTVSKLSQFESRIYDYLNKAAASKSGIVKDGLEVKTEANKIKVKAGYGYSTDGKLKSLETDSELNYEDNNSGYVFIDEENNLDFLERELQDDPYLYVMKLKNVLLIAVLKNNEIFPLNRDINIPNFPIGTMILSSNNNFKDFLTLRGCKKTAKLNDYFIKFGDVPLEFENKTIVMLSEENIPSLSLSGQTERDGEHTHYYNLQDTNGSMWEDVQGNAVGRKTVQTSLDGDHEHTANAVFNGKSAPFSLLPPHVKLIGIERIY